MTAKFCKQLFLLLVVTIATICSFFQFGEKVSFDNNNSRPTDPSALNSSAPFHCHRYMTVNTAGRLGNKISEYSTLLTNAIQYKVCQLRVYVIYMWTYNYHCFSTDRL